MEIDIELEREQRISENSKLMELLEVVNAQIGNPQKNRRVIACKESPIGKERKITIAYVTYCMGFSQGRSECIFIADEDYNFVRLQ